MRIAACLVAVLCAAPAVLAQEAIEWSRERRLTRDDFKGRVPAHASSASLSWINIDASWECEGATLVATARATFNPSRSWFRASTRSLSQDIQLLEHEQLHFDLAETVVSRIRAGFREFAHACTEPGGTDPIQQMIIDADRELQEEQQRYDRETAHGTNPRAQEQWKRRISARLK